MKNLLCHVIDHKRLFMETKQDFLKKVSNIKALRKKG